MSCQTTLDEETDRKRNVKPSGKKRMVNVVHLQSRITLIFVVGTALAFLFFGMAPADADPPFELDGNATSNNFPGDDWDVVNSGGGNPLARTGLIADRPEPPFAIFTGGGAKDEKDVPFWRHRSGAPPAKDDLTNAYAAGYENPDNGHLVIIYGMDRFDTSGSAQLGFWFLQQDVKPISGGTWNGAHVDGDILALVNFSGGGDVPTIQIFKWIAGVPVSQGSGQAVLCTNGFIPAGQSFCGITNSVSVPAPWPYENKDVGQTTQFPPAAFYEGAIDLTALGIVGCFSQFLAESRSSTSITATLKDFASPAEGFHLCEVDVTKACANPRLNDTNDKIIYDISGQVENIAGGSVFNVALSDAPPADGAFQRVDCTTGTFIDNFPFPGPLVGGQIICYKNTLTVPLDQNGLSDTITATANTKADGTGVTLTDQATADCPNLQVNAAIQISKDCSSIVAVQSATVVAKVNVSGQVCNTGDGPLSNVTVTDDKAGVLLTLNSLAEDACVPYSGSYNPTEAEDANGDPTNCPAAVVFKDTATADAVDVFGNPVTASDMADCPLCPGSCP
jgi:hypothetical protein